MTKQLLVVALLVALTAVPFACEDKKDDGKSNADQLGDNLNEAVNTGGTPHATEYRIDPDGSVHLVAASRPATQSAKK